MACAPSGLALARQPSALLLRSAHPPLLCEEGIKAFVARKLQRFVTFDSIGDSRIQFSPFPVSRPRQPSPVRLCGSVTQLFLRADGWRSQRKPAGRSHQEKQSARQQHFIRTDEPGLPAPPPLRGGGCLQTRVWGVFAPIYALHSKRNPNAGDLTDFEHLMDWMNDLGGSVAATLPPPRRVLDKPFEPSPYSPATRLSGMSFTSTWNAFRNSREPVHADRKRQILWITAV